MDVWLNYMILSVVILQVIFVIFGATMSMIFDSLNTKSAYYL